MPKPTTITANIQLVATDKTNWEGAQIFELVLAGEDGDRIVGKVYRTTHTTPIMARGANYSVGSRKRSGWEWRINVHFGREANIVTRMNSRTTSYTLFTSKIKAATDLAELITARTSA